MTSMWRKKKIWWSQRHIENKYDGVRDTILIILHSWITYIWDAGENINDFEDTVTEILKITQELAKHQQLEMCMSVRVFH